MEEDLEWSKGYGISDPLDVKCSPTGRVFHLAYDVYIKYHLKSGLPKYKKIRRQDLDVGPTMSEQ